MPSFRQLAGRLYRRFRPLKVPTHPFDLLHGLDTSGLLMPDELQSGHTHDRHITAYWGTAPSFFSAALDRWAGTLAQTPYGVEDYCFIDIGGGKGRVVMLASDTAFRQVLGVELNPGLVAVAQQNLIQWNATPHACADVSMLCADALAVPVPDTPVLLYLFNPFDAHVMQLFVERLGQLAVTRAHPMDILYVHPDYSALLSGLPGISLLWAGELAFSREDTAADAYRGLSETAHIFRLLPVPA